MKEIKKSEVRDSDFDSTRPGHPKAIILVPTNELALQIKSEAKILSKVMKIRAQAIYFGMAQKYLKQVLASRNDILILTPFKLLKLVEAKGLHLNDLTHLVVDEGDSMLDEGSDFGKDLIEIFNLIYSKYTELDPKVIIACATLTDAFHDKISTIEGQFPSSNSLFKYVISPGLHKPPRSCKQEFIKITEEGNEKQRMILSILKRNRKGDRILIFCDRIDSMDSLRKYLEKNGIMHYSWEKEESKSRNEELDSPPNSLYDCIHGYLPVLKRRELLDAFNGNKFSFLIASGLTARGMDFNCGVEHVILNDLPKNPIDYLHRIGRTARGKSSGRVTVFVTRSTERIAENIQKFTASNSRISGSLQSND